jgi:hypothetical protein
MTDLVVKNLIQTRLKSLVIIYKEHASISTHKNENDKCGRSSFTESATIGVEEYAQLDPQLI